MYTYERPFLIPSPALLFLMLSGDPVDIVMADDCRHIFLDGGGLVQTLLQWLPVSADNVLS